MMYLSKGLLVPEKDGTVRVSRCGRIFALGPEMATLGREDKTRRYRLRR